MRILLPALLALGLLHTGCALRGSRSGADRQTLVVLLPDDDGATGRARVGNRHGAADLAAVRQATDVADGRAPSPVRLLGERDVEQIFDEAISALPLPPLRMVLRFQFDSDDLVEESRLGLAALVDRVRDRPAPEVVVIGHTDTIGSRDLNRALGLRRAVAVRRALVNAGVDDRFIEATSHGEADPLVRTPDETSEPANRRVEVTIR